MTKQPELSAILPSHHEGRNLAVLLPLLQETVADLRVPAEIIVVVKDLDVDTRSAVERAQVRVIQQGEPGYGGAIRAGIAAATGGHVLTMDADLSHRPSVVANLWGARARADVIIASRYVAGGAARMHLARRVLSSVLNKVFARGLSLPVRDLSSGFRLYDARVLRGLRLVARDFDILQEILVGAYAEGWRILEIPFQYEPRESGSSNARVIPFGVSYVKTFRSLWRLRNSILSADYDDRAFDSIIPLQRYWQRQRHQLVTAAIPSGARTLDVGCGSSRIIGALPAGSVAADVLMRKLRYDRRFGRHLVQASGFSLPFADGTFPCVLCSQVIEHVPRDSPILGELCRVLSPGGRLILGTPDYGSWQWPTIEAVYMRVAPNAYADEHITHYTRQDLLDWFLAKGYVLEATKYILKAELILVLRKPAA